LWSLGLSKREIFDSGGQSSMKISDDIFEFLASDPGFDFGDLARAAEDDKSPIYARLGVVLKEVPPEDVGAVREDRQFQSFTRRDTDADWAARCWYVERLLSLEIPRRKLEVLVAEKDAARPRPYNVPALADLRVDDEQLVPLSEFEFDGSRLLRNGHAFTILTTTPSPNSTYWLARALESEGIAGRTSVRLDPYLFGPAETFPLMFYKMRMYGRPLDWDRIARLREQEHGRWLPENALGQQCQFTDVCWDPRGSEVHFTCEEVPTRESALREGSRYLHAVYLPGSGKMGHLDGALRLFTEAEIRLRHCLHVRNAGKVGYRQKVFRADEAIPREAFGAVTQAFFVWNQDIGTYLTEALVPSA
jgi:hypothetical protein